MKTILIALLLVTPMFAKFETKPWEPDPVVEVDEDGNIMITIPPLETTGEGQKL